MSLAVVEQNGQLVVDSRLIADELGIEHLNFLETIRKHKSEIEQDFGNITFHSVKLNGTGRPCTYTYLTEDQATYTIAISKNTDQLRLAKRNLVKAFSKARQLLQQKSTLDSDMLAALFSKISSFESTAVASQEYLDSRKYSYEHTINHSH